MMWAGTELSRRLGLPIVKPLVGETLDVSGLADMPSLVLTEDGARPLCELYASDPARFLKDPSGFDRFPLLVKRIDAGADLSIQVHPDDQAALQYEREPNGKSEAWVVLAAEDDARVWLGCRQDVAPEAVAEALVQGRIEAALCSLPVKKGDVIPVPAGCVHAIGGGIMIFEVQQPSNVTYRLFDYNREEKNLETGEMRLRPLHHEPGLKVIKTQLETGLARPRALEVRDGWHRDRLCDMGQFQIDRLQLTTEGELRPGGLAALQVTEGRLVVSDAVDAYCLEEGDSLILPELLTQVLLRPLLRPTTALLALHPPTGA